jgi:hypothetical protein
MGAFINAEDDFDALAAQDLRSVLIRVVNPQHPEATPPAAVAQWQKSCYAHGNENKPRDAQTIMNFITQCVQPCITATQKLKYNTVFDEQAIPYTPENAFNINMKIQQIVAYNSDLKSSSLLLLTLERMRSALS